MMKLWSYTREPIDNVYYDPRLAFSMHLAIEENGVLQALNHNSGVLFAKATENEDGSLNPKCLRNPYLFALEDSRFGILARQTGPEGEDEQEGEGKYLYFTTTDFVHYEEYGLITETCELYAESEDKSERLREAFENMKREEGKGNASVDRELPTQEEASKIEGAHWSSSIEISEKTAEYLKKKLVTPVHVDTVFPKTLEISDLSQLKDCRAERIFSDGTKDLVRVDWQLEGIDLQKSKEAFVEGRLHQEHFAFPMATNHADPCMGKWNGKYYFIATYDADHEHTMYIREGNSIPELVTAEEHLILDSTTYEGIGGLLWAPEFHVIGGRLCILHAATPGPFFEEESRIMILKEGGNPICKEDWEGPRRIVKADGSDICEAGKEITLDMTHFVIQGEDYVIWSQRQFLPKDLGAWLYIAKLNPTEPWKLASEPVVLTKPEYGWENNHTFVVEGPYALIRDNMLHITYSAAAVDTSYVVGLLSIEIGKDLLVPTNWRKSNYPILTSRSVEGEYGTGHNAYVTDDDGMTYTTYHARPGVDAPRCSGVRAVHFDVDNEPMLDLTEEMMLNREKATVRCLVKLRI